MSANQPTPEELAYLRRVHEVSAVTFGLAAMASDLLLNESVETPVDHQVGTLINAIELLNDGSGSPQGTGGAK